MSTFQRRMLVPVMAFAAALTACEEETVGPDVGPSSLEVRAYVDADGSGTFDEGDTPIAGATIQLEGPAGADGSATTGADGLATFDGLETGSYQLAFAGDVPAGATLAGATHPVVVVSTLRQELDMEFRFVNFPGSIEGVLYRDENGDGVFDEGDTPAPGIPVAVYAGGTAEGEPVAETTTSSTGAYSFEGLRPGTYTLLFAPFPTMELVEGATQTVTVGAESTTVHPVSFTGNLLSPISDARTAALAGEATVVAVEGVVIWQPSFSSELFIQDPSGGIQVYAGGTDIAELGLVPGDTVIVVGETSLRFGEPQITSVSALLPQGSGAAPDAEATTAEVLNAGTVQHELVTIPGATVTNVEVLSYGNQFVTLTDAAGAEFGVYADSRTGVESDLWQIGGAYDVTGVAGYDSRYAFPHRIEVRGTEDVVPGEQPATIAEALAAAAGTEISVAGVVTWQPSFSDELFIQDATGAIQIYAADVDASSLGLQPGDVVRVTGTTEDRFGERQLTAVTYLAVIGSQAAPEPVVVTPAQISTDEFLFRLVTVEGATVVSVDDSWNSFGNQLVTLSLGGEEFGVYVDSRTGVSTGDWTVGATVDVVGVINYDSRRAPFSYRIWLRGPADLVAN